MEILEDGKRVFQFAEECPICTEKYFEKAVINSCQHEFCFGCVLTWAEQENSCPLCKKKFTVLRKMVRYGKDANPTEVKSDIKRIAHKKQRPPEMSLAEFEQFQYNIELEELDEWIIDDEVYSAAMDVAPIDHLEVLEQSLAEMTRHNHRERRHHRNGTQTAHRKTKRRKPQSPVVREAIGPLRTRYTLNHHTNNTNNNNTEENTKLVDLASESIEESHETKYNLRKRKAPQILSEELIELTEDMQTDTEESETNLIVTDTCLAANVNDGRHFDRRSGVAAKKAIVKPTELNLPVAMFNDKKGDHDNHYGLSDDEIADETEDVQEHNFLEDVQIKPKVVEDRPANGVQSKSEENRIATKAPSAPQFTLKDIPFNDEDGEKVMPATNLSINNVSINNTTPEPAPKLTHNSRPVQGPLTIPRSLSPYPAAKKTPGIPAKFLSSPAIEKPPSSKTIIKEFKLSSNEPLSSAKAQIVSKLTPTQVQQNEGTTATEETNGKAKVSENSEKAAMPKRRTLAGRKGKEKRTNLSSKVTSSRARQVPNEPSDSNDKKIATNAKLIANDSSQNTVQTAVIDAQKLKKVSFKKKTVVQPAPNNVTPAEQAPVNDISAPPAPTADASADAPSNVNTLPVNNANTSVSTSVQDQSLANGSASTDVTAPNASNADTPAVNIIASRAETEVTRATASGYSDRIDSLIDKIAPVLSLNFAGVEQHGSYFSAQLEDGECFDSDLVTDNTTTHQQQLDNNDRGNNEHEQHSYDDRNDHYDRHQPNDSQFDRPRYDDRRRSNFSGATEHNGHNHYRSYDSQQHYNNNGHHSRGRYGYDNRNIRPFNRYDNNRRGYGQYNGRAHYPGRQYYDRPTHPDYYPRQDYDDRDTYTDQFAVPRASQETPPMPQHFQHVIPAQVLPQQVVQQVVAVQQVPTVPLPATQAAVQSEPQLEPETKADDFYSVQRMKQKKTPEPNTNYAAQPTTPLAVIKTEVVAPTRQPEVIATSFVIKTEPVSMVTQTEVPCAPEGPQPPLLPSCPLTSVSIAMQEPQPPQAEKQSQESGSPNRKRTRPDSPSEEEQAKKRRKLLDECMDKRAQRTSENDKDHAEYKEKDWHKDKDKHKDKERHKDKTKDKHESRDKDKRRNRDKDKSKKKDNKPRSTSREREQTIDTPTKPVVVREKRLKSVVVSDSIKASPSKADVAKNESVTATPEKQVKKKRLVSKVSLPKM